MSQLPDHAPHAVVGAGPAGHHAALRLLGRPELDPWEVNTERSYYEQQALTPDEKRAGTEILVADKALPHDAKV